MSATPSRFTKEAMLGAVDNVRGMVNVSTLAISFVLSIMVINTYRQCKDDKGNSGGGYKQPHTLVTISYWTSVLVLVASVLLLFYDILKILKYIK